MTEAALQGAVIGMCRLFQVAWYHTYNSRRSAPGWPDLALCGTRKLIFRELKTETGHLKPEQEQWGLMLRAAGQDWGVWRPADLA
ncbi:MAG: VRR-NUC domain-containing protein, partial [Actinocrinis sp.]